MPKPVLQAMVLADHVYRDVSGKHIICGTFTRYLMERAGTTEPADDSKVGGKRHLLKGPIAEVGTPYLYFALVEVHGQVPLELKYVDLSDANVLFETQILVTSRDPIAVSEYVMPIPKQIKTGKEGHYSLDLLHQGEILGQWRITIEFREQPKETGSEQ